MTQQEFGKKIRNAFEEAYRANVQFPSNGAFYFGQAEYEAYKRMPEELGLSMVKCDNLPKRPQLFGHGVYLVDADSYCKFA